MTTLELEAITDFFIRKKLGLKKNEEHKYDKSYKLENIDDRPYHKRLDLSGGSDHSEEDAFEHNKKICDIFKCYFKEISFSVHCLKGIGYYYIYPKNTKKFYEVFEKHSTICNCNGTIPSHKYYHKTCICGMGTTEIIKDILINCYIIEKTIKMVKKDIIMDIKNIINDKIDRFHFTI